VVVGCTVVGVCPGDSPAGPLSSVGDGAVVGSVVGAVVVGAEVSVGSAGPVAAGADVCTVDPDGAPAGGSGGRTLR
jgi:hypothetical protein